MRTIAVRLVCGFIAGMLAVAVFHQGMYALLQQVGLPLRGSPWNLAADPNAFGLPRLLNQMFWGGAWGVLFAALVDRVPAGPTWARGFVFGMIFPMLLGSWLLVAMLKGQPLFSGAFAKGFDIARLRNGFLLNGVAYGIGLGLLWSLLQSWLLPRKTRAVADRAPVS